MSVLIWTVVIINCCAASGQVPDAQVREEIDALIAAGRFETAAAYIAERLADSNDRSFLLLRMSQVQVNRGKQSDAFRYFARALAGTPGKGPPEETDVEIERLLNIAGALRRHEVYPVVESILRGVQKRRPHYSSTLYELANLYCVRHQFAQFFEHLYQAYRLNPRNPRCLPSLAVIESVVESQPPTPDDFGWLAAAKVYYDNWMLWANVMLLLKRHGLCESQSQISRFAAVLDEKTRHIFYCYYYDFIGQREKAIEALRSLSACVGDDRRLDLCRRNMFLIMGRPSDAVKELKDAPPDDYHKVLYYLLWLDYWDQMGWPANAVDHCIGLMEVLSDTCADVLESEERRANDNYLVAQWAERFLRSQKTQNAVALLEARVNNLDPNNLARLAELYIGSKRYVRAIRTMEKELALTASDRRRNVIKKILDYAVLSDQASTVRHYLKTAENEGMTDIAAEYSRVLDSQVTAGCPNRCILDVPGHYRPGDRDWRRWRDLGPCAAGSAFSILEFWQLNSNYELVAKDLSSATVEEGQFPVEVLGQYLQGKGLAVVYVAPTEDAAVTLLCNGIPVILVGTTFIEGLNFGHAGILYAYDHHLRKFFVRNVPEGLEDRISGANLFECTVLIGAAPPPRLTPVVTGRLKELVIPSVSRLLCAARIEELAKADPMLRWWAYKHNGDVLFGRRDVNCIDYYEKCLALKEPTTAVVYEKLVGACLRSSRENEARRYITLGLQKQPQSLLLLRFEIESRINAALAGSGLKRDLAGELLQLTHKMQTVNPDYPYTYFLRGDIYARGMADREHTINAFRVFLEKYDRMNTTWKAEHTAHRDHAIRAIKICRDSLKRRQ